MIAAWMIYCIATALCLGGAAAFLEPAARALGRPTRWVWLCAMAASLLAPAVAWYGSRAAGDRGAPAAHRAVSGEAASSLPPAGTRSASNRAPVFRAPTFVAASGSWLARLDRPLLLLWGLASAAMIACLAVAWLDLRRQRARWRPATVDETAVLVSDGVGPAVAGVIRTEIVLPAWALALERPLRSLLVAHEAEHVRAGDARLLAGALGALVLAPWNAALWWQLRRLRLAIELDCDARVLRAEPDVERYGRLLLEVGRRAVLRPLAAAGFAEGRTLLERRILAMTSRRARGHVTRAAGYVAAAALAVALACVAPHPPRPAPGVRGQPRALVRGAGSMSCEQQSTGPRLIEFVLDSVAATRLTRLDARADRARKPGDTTIEIFHGNGRSTDSGPLTGLRCAVQGDPFSIDPALRVFTDSAVRLIVRTGDGVVIGGPVELRPGEEAIELTWGGTSDAREQAERARLFAEAQRRGAVSDVMAAEYGGLGCSGDAGPNGITLLVSRAAARMPIRITVRVTPSASGDLETSMRAGRDSQVWCSGPPLAGTIRFFGTEMFRDDPVLTVSTPVPVELRAATAEGTILAGPVRLLPERRELTLAWAGRRP